MSGATERAGQIFSPFHAGHGHIESIYVAEAIAAVVKFVGECMDIVMDTSDGDAAGSPNQP